MKLLARFRKSKETSSHKAEIVEPLSSYNPDQLVNDINQGKAKNRLFAGIELLKTIQQLESLTQHQVILECAPWLLPKLFQRAAALLEQDFDNGVAGLDRDQYSAFYEQVTFRVSDADILLKLTDKYTESQFYDLALQAEIIQSRQYGAEQLQDPSLLKKLLATSKGHDKTVYKIVKEKCNKQHELEKLYEQNQQKISKLLEVVQKHAHHGFEPLYEAKLEHLIAEWQSIQSLANSEQIKEIEEHLLICQQTVKAQQEIKHQKELLQLAKANEEGEKQQIITELRLIVAALYSAEMVDLSWMKNIPDQVETLLGKWNSIEFKNSDGLFLNERKALEKAINILIEQNKSLGSTLQQVEQLKVSPSNHSKTLEALEKRLSFTIYFEETPSDLTEKATQTLNHIKEKLHSEKQTREKNLKIIQSLISRGIASAKKGQLKETQGISHSIDKVLKHLEAIPDYIQKKMNVFEEHRNKLQDWKEFVVEPKKEELVAKMQSLVESTLHPEQLAQSIKDLHNQWKSLSKGGGEQDQALWDSFHEAAEKAYQPCKAFFDKKSQQRKENTQKRQLVLTQLETFYQSYQWEENIDAHLVKNVLKAARNEWQQYGFCEHKNQSEMQHAFDKLMNNIYGHVKELYRKNVELKQQLIERVQGLLDEADIKYAIDEAKKIQAQWKSIGATPIKLDKKLWEDFRKYCDAIFEKRKAKFSKEKEVYHQNLKNAESLLKTMEVELSECNDLKEMKQKIAHYQQQYSALGELAKDKVNKVRTDFEGLIEKFKIKKIEIQGQSKKKLYKNILLKNQSLQSDIALLKTQAEAIDLNEYIQSINHNDELPQWAKEALIEKISVTQQSDLTDDEAMLHLKKLCIRAEIKNNRETPEHDKDLRLSLQVAILQQGFNGAQVLDSSKDIIRDWIVTPALAQQFFEPMHQRFMQQMQLD